MTSTRLELRDLSITLPDFALQDIDLDIRRGEYFVLLGPTGAGKTVLLEAIAGIKRPKKGRISLDGVDISEAPPEQRQMGFVYQDYALFPHLDVFENIAFGLRLQSAEALAHSSRGDFPSGGHSDGQIGGTGRELKPTLIKAKVERISRLLSIPHLLHRDTGTLSGGEKQRVALARALVIEPKILLLDEPLSALDPETGEKLQGELDRIHTQLGTTTLHITHNFEEAVALGDRIGVMMEGQITQVGEAQEIFRRPANEHVARFVGVRNLFRGSVGRISQDGYAYFETDGFKFAVLSDHQGQARGSIRPEDIILSRRPIQSSARNHFPGKVQEISDRGPFVYVTVGLTGDGEKQGSLLLTTLITHRSLEEMELQAGDEIFLAFKASALHIF